MNYNKENFVCGRKKSKTYLKSIGITEKTHTKFYITKRYQEVLWTLILIFGGIFGQILFRIYHLKTALHQWWWLFIIYFWIVPFSVIPGIIISIHSFYIDKIKYWYNENDIDNNENYPFIVKWCFKYLFCICEASYFPIKITELPFFS